LCGSAVRGPDIGGDRAWDEVHGGRGWQAPSVTRGAHIRLCRRL